MADLFDETQDTTSPVGDDFFDDVQAIPNPVNEDTDGDFIPGVMRGVQNLQATTYGAGALIGSGLKKLGMEDAGQKLQDVGMEGYRRNLEEAKQYSPKHSFKDIYTQNIGDGGIVDTVGGAVDWAQGTLGELVPSMVEAAVGAAIGSAIAPGVGSVAGGFAGRTILRKGIEEATEYALKQGTSKLAKSEIKKQITKQALKKLGAKAGLGAAVMPLESGGMYADLLENKGVDAPETALLFGALSTAMEFAGGNSKLVDTFIDGVSHSSGKAIKKSAKEILMNIPEEAAQEGGQEFMSVLNTVANTDEKLLTADNVEQIVASMAAGAVGGAAGAGAQSVTNTGSSNQEQTNDQESEINNQVKKIVAGGEDQIIASISHFDTQIQNNQNILKNPKILNKQAEKLNIEPAELFQKTTDQIQQDQKILAKLSGDEQANQQKEVNLKADIASDIDRTSADQLFGQEYQKTDDYPQQSVDEQTQDQANKYNQFINSQEERKQYFNQEIPTDEANINAVNYATYSPELPNTQASNQSQDLVTRSGKPYERPEGFTGVKKELDSADNLAFTNEQQITEDKTEQDQQNGQVGETSQDAEVSKVAEDISPGMIYEAGSDGLHYFTPRTGPSAGGTFATRGTSAEEISNALKTSQQKFIDANQTGDAEGRVFPQFQVGKNYVKSKSGEDFIGYHGTNAEPFNSFDNNKIQKFEQGWAGAGHYFTPRKDYASGYADAAGNDTGEPGRIAEARFSFKNPLYKNSPEYRQIVQNAIGRISILNKEDGLKATRAFKDAGYDAVIDGRSLDNALEINVFDSKDIHTVEGKTQFQVGEDQEILSKVNLDDVKKTFPNQQINQSDDGTISIRFKNGKGLSIKSMQSAGQGLIKLAIETGQMKEDGKILGVTLGNEILLDSQFADNKTLWHENKHVLDNLGMITAADNSALNKEFNRLRKINKLDFSLSTHEDSNQAMVENRANMFAQIMVNRETYRDKPLGKVIQKVMDFFHNLLSIGRQSVSGLAAEVESGKIYERKVGDQTLREGFPLFEVRNTEDQKVPQATYDAVFKERKNIVNNLIQKTKIHVNDVKLLADKALGVSSTRLKNVDAALSEKVRRLDFDTSNKVIDILKTATPILDITHGEKNKLGIRQGGMSAQDKSDWNLARLNADQIRVNQLAEKYNLTEPLTALREKLNQLRQDAINVGYDVGFIDEYWPRMIKDQAGFLKATQDGPHRAVFTEAIRAHAKKLGLSQEQFEREFPEVKADIISNIILGNSSGLGGPGNVQSRVFDTIPKEYAKFYMDADASLMSYIYGMTKKIEARKFFGKVPASIAALKTSAKRKTTELLKYQQLAEMASTENPEKHASYTESINDLNEDLALINKKLDKYKIKNDYTDNISTFIDDLRNSGKMQKQDEKVVRDILNARFNEHGTSGAVNVFKNAAYIDTMGSFTSAVTQIGDLAWAMYVGKVWTPRGFTSTSKNLTKAIFNKSKVTKEDLGLERIAQEFADGSTLGNAVNLTFKLVGLEKIDSIGKEVLINNALDRYKVQANEDPQALTKLIRPTFGSESRQVVQDLKDNIPSDNVKMLLYSKVLDFQPVALSEMPEIYLNGGNKRVFYMLKTFTLKQFDVFRREVFQNIKADNLQQKIQGVQNMVKLTTLLTLANASADEVKDFMLGKETRFSDNVIESLLSLGGASRYIRAKVSRDGIGSTLMQQILPPAKFINSISKDLNEGYDDYVSNDVFDFDHARIIQSIPGLGKLYYWHYGRGSDFKESLKKQDFRKAGKDPKLFKRQLENSNDKRLFIQSNLDRFKQMKLHQNFQASLNRNQAVINKLEKLPSTSNIETRLSQLKRQRELILDKYFEVSKSL